MRFFAPLFLFFVLMVGASSLLAADDNQVPLMEGLTVVPGHDALFTGPIEGKIIESIAAGPVNADGIYIFYRGILSHLGWQIVSGNSYRRHGQLLRIDTFANPSDPTLTVRFSARPDR